MHKYASIDSAINISDGKNHEVSLVYDTTANLIKNEEDLQNEKGKMIFCVIVDG